MKKKVQKTFINNEGVYELEGSLLVLIERFQNIIKDNPDYSDFEISVDSESGWYGDSSYYFSVWGVRDETDEEYNARLILEQGVKESAERARIRKEQLDAAMEQQLYMKLKAKYEPK